MPEEHSNQGLKLSTIPLLAPLGPSLCLVLSLVAVDGFSPYRTNVRKDSAEVRIGQYKKMASQWVSETHVRMMLLVSKSPYRC